MPTETLGKQQFIVRRIKELCETYSSNLIRTTRHLLHSNPSLNLTTEDDIIEKKLDIIHAIQSYFSRAIYQKSDAIPKEFPYIITNFLTYQFNDWPYKGYKSHADLLKINRSSWPSWILKGFLIGITFPITLPLLIVWSLVKRGTPNFLKTDGEILTENILKLCKQASDEDNISKIHIHEPDEMEPENVLSDIWFLMKQVTPEFKKDEKDRFLKTMSPMRPPRINVEEIIRKRASCVPKFKPKENAMPTNEKALDEPTQQPSVPPADEVQRPKDEAQQATNETAQGKLTTRAECSQAAVKPDDSNNPSLAPLVGIASLVNGMLPTDPKAKVDFDVARCTGFPIIISTAPIRKSPENNSNTAFLDFMWRSQWAIGEPEKCSITVFNQFLPPQITSPETRIHREAPSKTGTVDQLRNACATFFKLKDDFADLLKKANKKPGANGEVLYLKALKLARNNREVTSVLEGLINNLSDWYQDLIEYPDALFASNTWNEKIRKRRDDYVKQLPENYLTFSPTVCQIESCYQEIWQSLQAGDNEAAFKRYNTKPEHTPFIKFACPHLVAMDLQLEIIFLINAEMREEYATQGYVNARYHELHTLLEKYDMVEKRLLTDGALKPLIAMKERAIELWNQTPYEMRTKFAYDEWDEDVRLEEEGFHPTLRVDKKPRPMTETMFQWKRDGHEEMKQRGTLYCNGRK